MRLSELSPSALRLRLAGPGIHIETGPFTCHIRSRLPHVVNGIALAYVDYPIVDSSYADYHLRLAAPSWLRRVFFPQVQFYSDAQSPFLPLPIEQGYAMLEWGLNWCVSQHANQYLILHAAVLEKNGRALILPGSSGAGKSTLCAGLVYGGGWRLLSDELTLIRPGDGLIQPLPRPVSLKNSSIAVIQTLIPNLTFTKIVHDTLKGSVVHVKPPVASVVQQQFCVPPAWIVFPRYQAGAATRVQALPRARVALNLAEQAFNYSLHGPSGFETLTGLVERTHGYSFEYSDLGQAITYFEQLSAGSSLPVAQTLSVGCSI